VHRAELHCDLRPSAGAARLAGAPLGSGCPPRCRAQRAVPGAGAVGRGERVPAGRARGRLEPGLPALLRHARRLALRAGAPCPHAVLTSIATACPCMSWHILSSTRSNTCTSPRRSVAGRASREAVPLCARSVTGARHAQDRQRALLRLCYQALCSETRYSHAGSAALSKPSSVPALAPHRAAGQRTKLHHINAVTRAWCGHAGPE